MDVEYIIQPDMQLGKVLSRMMKSDPPASRIVFVSAFASMQTIMRVKHQIIELRACGATVRFVLGIDLGGTSQEVLSELLDWGIDVRLVKHRIARHTFHPKIYMFEWADHAAIILGSNNFTEGGFFGNYEGSAKITYQLPADAKHFSSAHDALKRFLNPTGSTAYPLNQAFLAKLIANQSIPTEEEARTRRNMHPSPNNLYARGDPVFGTEDIDLPPPLPAALLERLVKNQRKRASRQESQRTPEQQASTELPVDVAPSNSILPAAFYMTLPTLQGRSIPGESRIPLAALEIAQDFWGWPDEYNRLVSPRGGHERVYWEQHPQWRIWSVETPDDRNVQEVRMYKYENSSDFRFYARPLVEAGADQGDLVRIVRIAEQNVEYECTLARQGTTEYNEWIDYCTQPIRNSPRRFGYA